MLIQSRLNMGIDVVDACGSSAHLKDNLLLDCTAGGYETIKKVIISPHSQ